MVSPYIFILAVEILLIKINSTKNIEGITYAKKESRSETLADDASIFIKRNPDYLRECVKILKHFAMQCYEKIHGISMKWARYQLSLKGCIMIAKTFLLPQFTYIALVLDPNAKTYETINRFIRNFINTGTTKHSTRNFWIH